MSAPEFNKKISISIGAIVGLLTASFSLGVFYVSIVGLDNKIDAEIGGLRADMEKEDGLIREEIKRVDEENDTRQNWQNARMDRKVKNHELIYHKE